MRGDNTPPRLLVKGQATSRERESDESYLVRHCRSLSASTPAVLEQTLCPGTSFPKPSVPPGGFLLRRCQRSADQVRISARTKFQSATDKIGDSIAPERPSPRMNEEATINGFQYVSFDQPFDRRAGRHYC